MAPTWLATVDRFWARDLGCQIPSLHAAETRVQEHSDSYAGYRGVFILVTDGAPLVSVPTDLSHAVRDRLARLRAADVGDTRVLHQILDACGIDQIIGPAFIGYKDAAAQAGSQDAVRVLGDADEGAFRALESACSELDWQHGAPPWVPGDVVGAFSEAEELSAVAGFKIWGEAIAHIYVVSRPAHRGQGHGLSAVEAAVRVALERGLVPQFRTLESNLPAMHIARRLRFQRYGLSVAVRLAAEA